MTRRRQGLTTFTPSAGVGCALAVAAERDRVMAAAQGAVDGVG